MQITWIWLPSSCLGLLSKDHKQGPPHPIYVWLINVFLTTVNEAGVSLTFRFILDQGGLERLGYLPGI